MERTRQTDGNAPPPWHALPRDMVLRMLESDEQGLSSEEARRRLLGVGPNLLPRAPADTARLILWRQVNTPLVWVLVTAAGVAMIIGTPTDGLVVLAVVVANTMIGFVQEHRAGVALEALLDMVPEQATVVRDGRRTTIAVAELVPGDVVVINGGDKVPADIRLLNAKQLHVDEAALTGESVPSAKQVNAVTSVAALGDRTSMAFGGTLVAAGTGTGVVCATAARSELGRISTLLGEAVDLDTPITKAIGAIGRRITTAILAVAAVMVVVGVWRDMATGTAFAAALRDSAMFAIALAVGAIPEGLPAIVTIALAIGVQRMARRRAIVRRLPAVETLGSTTVICSDKTGTLTRNEMTVVAVWTPECGEYTVSGAGYAPDGAFSHGAAILPEPTEDLRRLLQDALLCSDATLHRDGTAWHVSGDPTEGALVVAAQKAGIDPERTRRALPRHDVVPFESEYRFMATLNGASLEDSRLIVKGAPEAVVRRCARVDADAIHREVERMAQRGMRVLAVAGRTWGGSTHLTPADIDELMLSGLIGMIDPPRPEAIAAVHRCHSAGITVNMITGDHQATAIAIGRQLGLSGDVPALAGTALADMDDAALRHAARTHRVFARVAPEHKLRLVRALQRDGHVVAMTGDGVNDAPALKQADIGVAMGITGTSVSKEAADIVLTDDNFATIAAAVEEGRRTYDNLIKSLAFVLPTNLGLALILIVAVAFFPFDATTGGLLLPMLPTQLLWINLVATVALALPLAFEAPEPNVMSRPPRNPGTPALEPFVVRRMVLASVFMTAGAIGLFLYEVTSAPPAGDTRLTAVARAQTMAVTSVVMFQIFYVLTCRSMRGSMFATGVVSNPYIWGGIAVAVLLQAIFIYAGPFQTVFSTSALRMRDVALSVAIGALIVPAVAAAKRLEDRVSTIRSPA